MAEAEGLAWPGFLRVLHMAGRGLVLHCPRCGGHPVLRDWFHLRERCPKCGVALERGEGSDYFVGGMFLNIALCLIIFALGFWGVLIITYPRVPWNWLEYGLAIAMLTLPILLYPVSRMVWLGIDLAVRPRSERNPEERYREADQR